MSWSDEKIGAELANTPARSNIGEGEYPTSSTMIELTPTIFWSNGFIAISAFAFALPAAAATAGGLGGELVAAGEGAGDDRDRRAWRESRMLRSSWLPRRPRRCRTRS